MTTMNEAKEAIYVTFKNAWEAAAASSSVPYTFDNEDFNNEGLDNWARLAIRHTGGGQETLGRQGNRKFARTGSVFIQIFTPVDSGVSGSDSLVTVAREAFEGVSITGTTVRFYDVIARETGPDKKWYQTTVEAVFEYDETR